MAQREREPALARDVEKGFLVAETFEMGLEGGTDGEEKALRAF